MVITDMVITDMVITDIMVIALGACCGEPHARTRRTCTRGGREV
jgi:hypothetical protein